MASNVQIKTEYQRTLRANDFDNTTDASLDTSSFKQIAEFVVPAGQRVFVGNGKLTDGIDDRGTFVFTASDGTNKLDGQVRVVLSDANAVEQDFLREDINNDLESGVNVGKGGKTGVPSKDGRPLRFVTQDESIKIEMAMDTTSATLSWSDSSIEFPVTIQAVKTR